MKRLPQYLSDCSPVALAALVLSLLAVPAVSLGNMVPDPANCIVAPDYGDALLVDPGGMPGATYTITILNSQGLPFPNAYVRIDLDPTLHWCAGASQDAITDGNGVCQIEARAGGCFRGPHAAQVTANGVIIRDYPQVRSPDNASHDIPAADGTVAVSDLPYFAEEFTGAAPAGCHDYTNDGTVSTSDLPLFADAFKSAISCELR